MARRGGSDLYKDKARLLHSRKLVRRGIQRLGFRVGEAQMGEYREHRGRRVQERGRHDARTVWQWNRSMDRVGGTRDVHTGTGGEFLAFVSLNPSISST